MRLHIPAEFDRYVEPFAGSACLFFNIKPDAALLSDFNSDLIHAFRFVAKHPRLLSRQLNSFADTKQMYYELRSLMPKESNELQRAAYFIYLNSYCFNGVYRTNNAGIFNVPRGTKSRGVPTLNALLSCSIALRCAEIACQDYRTTLKSCRQGDFVYLDPPYTNPTARYRGEYGIGSFSEKDEGILLQELRRLNSLGVKFLLSYRASSSFLRLLDRDWHAQRVRVKRSIAGFAEARRTVFEILVRNYDI